MLALGTAKCNNLEYIEADILTQTGSMGSEL